jgi:hypothetical protein
VEHESFGFDATSHFLPVQRARGDRQSVPPKAQSVNARKVSPWPSLVLVSSQTSDLNRPKLTIVD